MSIKTAKTFNSLSREAIKAGEIFNIFTGKKDVNETTSDGEYTFFSCSPNKYRSDSYIHDGPAIIITGNGSYTGTVRFFDGKFDLYQRTYGLTLKDDMFHDWDIKFLYFYFKIFFEREFMGGSCGSSIPYIIKGNIENFQIPLLDLDEQKQIAEILSSLDDKIELNRRINANLEAVASALFKKWFVDIGDELPEGWRIGAFGEAAENLDSKRIPLSSREREQGLYPYYGATSVMDYIKNYIFDGTYVLLGEDGSVAKEDGKPFVQYVSGKIWVNNHAHVLRGKNGFSTEYLKVLLEQTNITSFITGAVQPKLNQANMNKIPMIIPDQKTLNEFNDISSTLFSIIIDNENQNKNMEQIRDSLLPRLMNGKIMAD